MPEELPVISIIIPCYNYAHFLQDAIDSALGQTYARCEVIVVDDGSTDNTARVAQSYGDSIRYHYQGNAGLSAARNTGVKISTGDLLVFLDADDKLNPQMVSRSYEAMMQLGESFGVVASQTTWIDKEGEQMIRPSLYSVKECEVTTLDLLIKNRFGVTVLARKQVFDHCGGFDVKLKASEDRDMWVRATAAGFRISRLGDSLFYVRRHGDNMSNNGVMQTRSIKQVQEKALATGVLSGWMNIYRLKIKAYYLYQKGVMRASKQPLRGCFDIMVSITLWPVFSDLESLWEKPCFRIKMIGWILSQTIRRRW